MGAPGLTDLKLKYVDAFRDGAGRWRYYFRRHRIRTPLPGLPGSAEFMDTYANALAAGQTEQPVAREIPKAGTFRALAILYFQSPAYQNLAASSRMNYRRVIESFLREHGHGKVNQFRRGHASTIINRLSHKPGAANVLVKRIRTLTRFAINLEWIEADPLARFTMYRSTEFHTWTEAEIATFEERWALGTPQRLGFAILLYTGQRVSDAHNMVRPDASHKVRVTQMKTGTPLTITAHQRLLEAQEAYDGLHPNKHAVMLPTAFGRPFTSKGFSNFMGDAIRAAGLPPKCKSHGLRKAAARRLAEVGCTPHEIMSVTGHRTLSEVERYTRAAGQEKLNARAMKKFGTRRAKPRDA